MSNKKAKSLFPIMPADSYPEPLIHGLLSVVRFPDALHSNATKETLVRHLCANIGLDLYAKHRALVSLPYVTTAQCDLMINTWRDEEAVAANLFSVVLPDGINHTARTWLHNSLLATFMGAQWSPEAERTAMRSYLESNYVNKKQRLKQLKSAVEGTSSVCVAHVFGRALRDAGLEC